MYLAREENMATARACRAVPNCPIGARGYCAIYCKRTVLHVVGWEGAGCKDPADGLCSAGRRKGLRRIRARAGAMPCPALTL